ncbi:MAG TPA: GntR family transcriptional regulator [Vicinamibacteria bacterium]|nr:GntR family transcriptional regulator [Vicinamibacteria bacterium]
MPLAPPAAARFRTKQELVYRTLRDAIMICRLAPGERLVIDELARQLEVSAIPVREALQLLQSEGLVRSVPPVGATVAPSPASRSTRCSRSWRAWRSWPRGARPCG